ncbi:MAG: hypothetical protein ABSH47_27060 [Bryobacteraceae bacterium]
MRGEWSGAATNSTGTRPSLPAVNLAGYDDAARLIGVTRIGHRRDVYE